MWTLIIAIALSGHAPATEQTFSLRATGEPALFVRHMPGSGPSVLYVHGATFPSGLSIAYRIDGRSWADDLHERGFDVWSFDFAGYGGSERPAAMTISGTEPSAIPGRAPDAAHQIERIVAHVRAETRQSRVSIIAHSWGTLPTGLFASAHPDWLSKLVLFGPVTARHQVEQPGPVEPSRLINEQRQWGSFQAGVPAAQSSPIDAVRFRDWIAAYLETDPASAQRTPPSVEVPTGPDADFSDAWSGHFPYDPSQIRTPTLIVRGEWDPVATDADAEWLRNAMTRVPGGARDVKLPTGAHRMHLETNRQALFDVVGEYLAETEE